jgi:hypothetical protein
VVAPVQADVQSCKASREDNQKKAGNCEDQEVLVISQITLGNPNQVQEIGNNNG